LGFEELLQGLHVHFVGGARSGLLATNAGGSLASGGLLALGGRLLGSSEVGNL